MLYAREIVLDGEKLQRHKHNRVIDGQRLTWQVARLWELARDWPVAEIPLTTSAEADRNLNAVPPKVLSRFHSTWVRRLCMWTL